VPLPPFRPPPGSLNIAKPVENTGGPLTFSIVRPRLGYPALLYTPLANAEALLLADAAAAATEGRLAGFPDPDVTRIRIDVIVASLEFDPENHPEPEPRRLLYSTFREFDDDPEQPLELIIEFEDENDLATFPAPTAVGPIKLPTARTINLTFTPVARQDPGMLPTLADPAAAEIIDPAALDKDDSKLIYFGKHAARVGTRRIVTERRESAKESGLFQEVPGVPFQGIFLQPSPAHDAHLNDKNSAAGTRDQAPESAIQRLARQLRMENRDLTLIGEAGRRLVFGASAAVRHHLLRTTPLSRSLTKRRSPPSG